MRLRDVKNPAPDRNVFAIIYSYNNEIIHSTVPEIQNMTTNWQVVNV